MKRLTNKWRKKTPNQHRTYGEKRNRDLRRDEQWRQDF